MIQVVVVGDQGAIVGKNYWVDVETANALSPPGRMRFRIMRQAGVERF